MNVFIHSCIHPVTDISLSEFCVLDLQVHKHERDLRGPQESTGPQRDVQTDCGLCGEKAGERVVGTCGDKSFDQCHIKDTLGAVCK